MFDNVRNVTLYDRIFVMTLVCRLMSFVIHAVEVGVNEFMAEVATNDQFSGLYISTYDSGQQHQQQQLQQKRDDELELQAQDAGVCSGGARVGGAGGVAGYGNLNVYIEYADSLAKCGRVCESLDLYARCFRAGPLPANFLWHVTSAFLEMIRLQAGGSNGVDQQQQQPQSTVGPTHASRTTPSSHVQPSQQPRSFDCGVCELVLRDPVTLLCGHTFCRRCTVIAVGSCSNKSTVCHKCGVRTPYQPNANVLIKSLIEKLWPVQLRASELLDEGKALYRQDKLHSALLKFNQAYFTGTIVILFSIN